MIRVYLLVSFLSLFSLSFALNVNVAPGGNIQNAINQVSAAGGGVVQLEVGVYMLSNSIFMKSNVTLQGVGTDTRIELPLDATYAMIVDDGTEPCNNMTVRNMLLDGNIPESKVSHDPDYTTDPQNPCLGILFDAHKEETYHTNVVIENVEIHNTVDGCHLKGVRGGYMDNVYMHHNGIFFWPGHNAYLRRCIDYTVKNSRFEDSYNGSGVNCSWSKNLLFSNCVVARSEGRGIRNAASEGFVIHDCIIVDCGAEGIIANAEQGITTSNCDFRRNCISGNGTGMYGGSSGVAYDNRVFNNGNNIELGSEIIQKGNTTTPGPSCAVGLPDWSPIGISALVTNENPKQVVVKVSQNIAESETYEGFTLKVDGAQVAISSVALLNSTDIAINVFDNVNEDNTVTLSYSESGNVQTDNGTALIGFEDMVVVNATGLPIIIETITIDAGGEFVTFKFNVAIGTIHNQSDNFTFHINDETVTTTRTVVGDSSIQVYPFSKIYLGDEVNVSFSPREFAPLSATNTTELEAFSNLLLENSSVLVLPVIPGKIESEDYDYHFGLRLENCGEGGQNLAYIDDGDWAEYNVRAKKDTTYKATFRVASPDGGGTITVYVDGKTKGIITVPRTGAWQTYQSVSADMKLTSGAHAIKTSFSGGFNVNWMIFEETEPGNEGVFFDRIEAESFSSKSGGSVEDCSDTDGGENVGSMRTGNWLMFSAIDLSRVGGVDMRLAHKTAGSSIEVRIGSASGALLGTVTIPNTGGYQDWQTISTDLKYIDGTHDIYLVFRNSGGWAGNINWFQFYLSETTALHETRLNKEIKIYPNPFIDNITIKGALDSKVEVYNLLGKLISVTELEKAEQTINLSKLSSSAYYFFRVIKSDGMVESFKMIKK